MNIEKELQKGKEAFLAKENDVMKEVKLLLNSEDIEDLRISNALGKNHSLARAQEKIGKQIEFEKLEGSFAGNVFHIDDIKKLCLNYRMRFLQSKHFAGHLDVVAIQKLKEFAKTTKVGLDTYSLEGKYFILAPSELFKLDEKRLPRISFDPAMFYQIDATHYRLIHKWGKDFTLLRLIKGFYAKSLLNRVIAQTTVAAVAFFCLSYFTDVNVHPAVMILTSVLGLLFANIKHLTIKSSFRQYLYTAGNWNKHESYS